MATTNDFLKTYPLGFGMQKQENDQTIIWACYNEK
jgi:hypothetical protein